MVEVLAVARFCAMELITILNRCHRFREFVYHRARFTFDHKSIEISVRPASVPSPSAHAAVRTRPATINFPSGAPLLREGRSWNTVRLHCETMATLIRPSGQTEEATPLNGKRFTLEEMQRFVGGDVQLLEVTPGIYGAIKVTARDKMFVVREEKLHGLPFNRVATAIYIHSARDRVFGFALITRKDEF